MPSNGTDTHDITDTPVPKDWMQIRIEKETAAALDKIHIERRESYNDIIKRLIHFWQDNPDIVEPWVEKEENEKR